MLNLVLCVKNCILILRLIEFDLPKHVEYSLFNNQSLQILSQKSHNCMNINLPLPRYLCILYDFQTNIVYINISNIKLGYNSYRSNTLHLIFMINCT